MNDDAAGYTRVVTVRSTRYDDFEEAERMKKRFDGEHRVVQIEPTGGVFVEQRVTDGPRWVRAGYVETNGDWSADAAVELSKKLESSEFRVVFDYVADEWLLEVQVDDE